MPTPESQPAAATEKFASATPSATVTTTPATVPSKPLPRPAFWAALLVAAGLPVLLLVTVVVVLVSLNYNFMEWME